MILKKKREILIGVSVIFLSTNLFSQTPSKKSNSITLFSNPTGATIELVGQYTIRGMTPITIPYRLEGRYKITASKYGYETWSTYYNFDGETGEKFTFKLSPKTRWKAGLRSLFFPGWGQYYSDRKFAGSLLASIQIASVIITLKKENDYLDITNDYNRLLDRYEKERLPYKERKNLLRDLQNQEKKADDAFENRQTWIYISSLIWIYNFFDAVIFFDFDKLSPTKEIFPSFSVNSGAKEWNIHFRWNF